MVVTTQMVKELREQTGAGIMDAKRALEQASGDMGKAAAILQQQGLAKAAKKVGRTASQGLVEAYLHGGGRIGAMVELNCETDFVARTPEFKDLAHDLAMQVAATDPQYLSVDEIPESVLDEGTEREGGRDEFVRQAALLAQPFIKDPRQTIEAVIKDHIARIGENIVIRRFARFELGAESDSSEG